MLLGIDLGTQSLKCIVCDDALAIRGQHAVAYATAHPAPGWAEQDPRAWEAALAPAIAGALAAARVRPDAVRALALTGQLDGCVAVDARCAPLHPALIWQDRRAVAEARRADPARVFALTGQVADASHLAPKAAWLAGALRARGVTHARFHQPTSYLVERLTGAAVIDHALASTTMLFALPCEDTADESRQGATTPRSNAGQLVVAPAGGTWSSELLAAFALDAAQLPAITDACAIAGALTDVGARLTGLPAGVRVAVGTGDDFTNALGAGVVAPGTVVCALGTAEVVGTLARSPVRDTIASEPMVETHVYPVRGTYFVEHPGWLSGGAVRWVTTLMGLANDTALDALAAQAPPGANGVTFVPALAGGMTPVWRPEMRGALHGLAAGHDQRHVARAVLEGLAFACRDVVERLAAMGLGAREVVLVGGGANSEVWTQIRADVIGLSHRVAKAPDTSPLGAAMIAAVAAGAYPDLAAAAARAPGFGEPVLPTSAVTEAVDAAYRRYQQCVGLGLSALVGSDTGPDGKPQ